MGIRINLLVSVIAALASIVVAMKLSSNISKPMQACAQRMKLLVEGDLSAPVPQVRGQDETAELTRSTAEMVTGLSAIIGDISYLLDEMSNQNFDVQSLHREAYVGEFQSILHSMRTLKEQLSGTIRQINASASQVSSASGQVSNGSQSLSQGAVEQASAVEELAATISDIPFDGPCATTQVGMVDGEFVFNPTAAQKEVSDLHLTVASTRDKVIMIEAGANEVPEAKMIDAIFAAHAINQDIIKFIDTIVAECGKEKHSYTSFAVPEELFAAIRELVPAEEMEKAVFTDDKQTREENIRTITDKLEEAFSEKEEWLSFLGEAVYQYQKKTVRKMILKDHKRPDGREITQIRPLAAEVDLIPRVHGSAMFTRGQTQICTITTLAPLSEAQRLDGLDEAETSKRYMHHYNFPSYSVGETRPSRGPGRREIGHGALAERALLPVLPGEEEFPYAIRTVSETFESNGSTSQASVCASTMSLMAAGVPIKRPVAGISCGLVTGETDDDYLVLTDIQGLEDFFGDMDFKVAGTDNGITAIQMDIKIHGLTRAIIEEAIARTKEARTFILHGVMEAAIASPRAEVGPYAPKIIQIQIDPQKIGDVVGQRGKTINAIIEQTGVKIDITDDGAVSICGTERAAMDKAIELIRIITTDFEAGQIFVGKVVSIKEFGAFLEFAPGKEGMVHISKISKQRINRVEDELTLGDMVKVVCLGKDKMGRISFSIKDVK